MYSLFYKEILARTYLLYEQNKFSINFKLNVDRKLKIIISCFQNINYKYLTLLLLFR